MAAAEVAGCSADVAQLSKQAVQEVQQQGGGAALHAGPKGGGRQHGCRGTARQ